MMADTLISPGADHDIRKRCATYKRRSGVPDFRDILRQRCRERVKSKRGALFDHLRALQNEESVRSALSQFIESDLKELQSSSTLKEAHKNELMDVVESEPLSQLAVSEREKWILDEYDRLIENINAQAELASVVVCPLCMRGVLSADQLGRVVKCSQCPLMLPHKMPLAELESLIIHTLDCHSQFCIEKPQFTVCPDNTTTNLLLLCSFCDHFQQVI